MGEKKEQLILLYGYISNEHNAKTQALIDGDLTCGYREYAKNAGSIIYMAPQERLKEPWELCLTKPSDIIDYCNARPDAVVWSIKYSPAKNEILQNINNFKIHYACQAKNMIHPHCDVSLVDTPKRVKGPRCRLHVKGKDPEFWKPSGEKKKYDYLLMGRRDDKNQSYFVKELNRIKSPRSILWIGGKKFAKKVKSRHHVEYTHVYGPDMVASMISLARVGILFSQIRTEGFPQTFLEMTMCGVPVVYGGPMNPHYFFEENSRRPKKSRLIGTAEELLESADAEACRKCAIENYSIQKSIDRLLSFR